MSAFLFGINLVNITAEESGFNGMKGMLAVQEDGKSEYDFQKLNPMLEIVSKHEVIAIPRWIRMPLKSYEFIRFLIQKNAEQQREKDFIINAGMA